jgi:ketosteroid isomerase-like protein
MLRSAISVVRDFDFAWSRRDLNTLLRLIADDCVFSASVGDEPGATFRGRSQVAKGFRLLLELDAGAEAVPGELFGCGSRVIVTWGLKRREPDGRTVTVRGCDIFTVREGLIVRKDAFRKTRCA